MVWHRVMSERQAIAAYVTVLQPFGRLTVVCSHTGRHDFASPRAIIVADGSLERLERVVNLWVLCCNLIQFNGEFGAKV